MKMVHWRKDGNNMFTKFMRKMLTKRFYGNGHCVPDGGNGHCY